ncbi:hypothetical protein [Nocardia rhizosphaerae]|uniref:RNA polymerase sigma-70 factor (ECF subfamily) n=1 Tax=Nocardia rhizosphaerae TaxID=1691571 RepID=A0ABV8L885_9NOCA
MSRSDLVARPADQEGTDSDDTLRLLLVCCHPSLRRLSQIAVLYEMLERVAPGPIVTLNRAVAVGMADGPERGPAMITELLDDPAMARHHRTHAVWAHLMELTGDTTSARAGYARAAQLTASVPEQRYLNERVRRLDRDRQSG